LRCINAARREPGIVASIMRDKDKTMFAPLPEPAANLAQMAGRIGVSTVAAAWPTGLAHLGLTVTTCERCEAIEVCRDWLARTPQQIDHVPPFCPNAGRLRAAKRRG
jgi:hypothetical protein